MKWTYGKNSTRLFSKISSDSSLQIPNLALTKIIQYASLLRMGELQPSNLEIQASHSSDLKEWQKRRDTICIRAIHNDNLEL